MLIYSTKRLRSFKYRQPILTLLELMMLRSYNEEVLGRNLEGESFDEGGWYRGSQNFEERIPISTLDDSKLKNDNAFQ